MGATLRNRIAFQARAACAAAFVLTMSLSPAHAKSDAELLAALPLPPAIDRLIGLPQTYQKGRAVHLALITREAERAGLPAAVADAVSHVESRFNPMAVGGVGEVGLMQIRPQTAAMLGYKGGLTGLFDPETNVHFGVKYLAHAWVLAKGDLCRALMKYRAGWGEERMSPLSAEYCRRARQHLAAIGSPLADGAAPAATEVSSSFAEQVPSVGRSPARTSPSSNRVRVAAVGPVEVPQALNLSQAEMDFRRELKRARSQVRNGTRTTVDTQRYWTAHEARIREIKARLKVH